MNDYDNLVHRCRCAYEKIRDWNERWFAGEDPEPVTDVDRRGALAFASLAYRKEMDAANCAVMEELAVNYKCDQLGPLVAMAQAGRAARRAGVPMHINDIDYDRVDRCLLEAYEDQ